MVVLVNGALASPSKVRVVTPDVTEIPTIVKYKTVELSVNLTLSPIRYFPETSLAIVTVLAVAYVHVSDTVLQPSHTGAVSVLLLKDWEDAISAREASSLVLLIAALEEILASLMLPLTRL